VKNNTFLDFLSFAFVFYILNTVCFLLLMIYKIMFKNKFLLYFRIYHFQNSFAKKIRCSFLALFSSFYFSFKILFFL
jgi:hypothetical protein